MVFRYSWLAGSTALLFVLYQLNGLLRPTVEGPPWQLVVVAALVLGVAITWTVIAYRLPTWVAVVINGVAALIAAARVSAPETTLALLPTSETFSIMDVQLSNALRVVRNGIEPVIPTAGLVVMLLALFWAVGFLFAWGLSTSKPYVALLPPLVISLQFATMDRQSTTAMRTLVYIAIVAACLLAVTLDQRQQGAGRMVAVGDYGPPRSGISRSSAALLSSIVVVAVGTVTVFGGVVPADGVVEWRSPTGLTGDFYGSVSYNPFIGIKQSLVSNTDTPVFAVRFNESDIPTDQIYFSLLTMDTYSGGQFSAVRPEVVPLEEENWVAAGHTFAGPVDSIVAEVEIKRLEMEWLPSPHATVDFESANNIRSAVRVRRDDAALRFEGGLTFDGMRYVVRSEIPRPDINVLATTEAGSLSPAFREAEAADEDVPEPRLAEVRAEPPEVDKYLEVPDDLDSGIEAEARRQTRNLETSFEKAIALESWFRSDAFRYTTDIVPGHGATDLADWLLDPTSPNYRAGYCENFATSMAVMARALDIPSRVVLGFTPGSPQADGTIVVRDRNAHAWVQLWMPTQGWVRFDPTPRGDQVNPTTYEEIETSLGFPLTDYLDVPNPERLPVNVVVPGFELEDDSPIPLPPFGGVGSDGAGGGLNLPGWVTSLAPWLILLAAAATSIPLLKRWRRRRRIRRLRSGDISAAWEEIVARLEDFGSPPHSADTPTEAAAKVDAVMAPLAIAYSRSLYGPSSPASDELVRTATISMEQTTNSIVARHSLWERMRAGYRIKSLMPRRRKN